MAEEAKAYLYRKQIPQLFENLLSELMCNKPDNPVNFLIERLQLVQNNSSSSETAEMEKITSKPIIFVLGGPGSGKGTQCSRVVQEFGFVHLSAGELLRQEIAKGTEQGQQLEEAMKEGRLVPAVVTVGLLKAAMLSNLEATGYLIDGFPRELCQGELFKQQVCNCLYVLLFECSKDVMVERLVARGKTSGRVDDNEETIRKRLDTFEQSTLPVIEHYEQAGKVKKINANRSVEEVYSDVAKLFNDFTSK